MKFHHVGIVVSDMDRAIEQYSQTLGLAADSATIFDPVQDAHLTMMRGRVDDIGVELVTPASPDSPLAAQAKRGGIAHICYEVDDLEAEIARQRRNGAIIVQETTIAPLFGGRRIGFVFSRTGILLEFLEKERPAANAEAAIANGDFAAARRELASLLETATDARSIRLASKVAEQIIDAGPALPSRSVYVLQSFTFDPLGPYLRAFGCKEGLDLTIKFGSFNQFEQEIAGLGKLPPEPPHIVLIAARLEELAPALIDRFTALSEDEKSAEIDAATTRVSAWIEGLRRRWPDATILLQGVESRQNSAYGIGDTITASGQNETIRALGRGLAQLCQASTGVYYIDINSVFAAIGRNNAYDARMWAVASLPYTGQALHAMAGRLARVIAASQLPRRKCIVLDCDNTLWGGVLGEVGPNGIAVGRDYPGSAYAAFQDALLAMRDRGIILTLCTKNNPEDVMEVLEKHPSQRLRSDHFAAVRIGWKDKASAIEELARELNIGLDSLVFIDDSAFECGLVRDRLPMVEVIQAPRDPLALCAMLSSIASLDTLRLSDDDRRRNGFYRQQKNRTETRTKFASLKSYLQSLDMRLTLSRTGVADVARVAQLTQKTNQFNLTTRRYSEQEIGRLAVSPDAVVMHGQLFDVHGEQGITAAVILMREARSLRIDTFLMSCRIIGRDVEDAILAWIMEFGRQRGVDTVIGEHIPTEKNGQTREFFKRHGFEAVPGRAGLWSRNSLALPRLASPDHVRLIVKEQEELNA